MSSKITPAEEKALDAALEALDTLTEEDRSHALGYLCGYYGVPKDSRMLAPQKEPWWRRVWS